MKPEEIRELRQRMGLSMEDFAREVGTCTSTIFRWEKGERRPGRMAKRLLDMVKEKIKTQENVTM